MTTLWFAQALLPEGWTDGVRITTREGTIAGVESGVAPQPQDSRYATGLPGLSNLHSHAFQRLMAGLAETRRATGTDDFWSWRELMYRLVNLLSPDDLAAIAAMAYVEMLEAGFTRVGEFHYLHNDPQGRAYAHPAEMAAAIAQAALDTGIGLTLLPVFYAHADFGGQAPHDGQRRFICDVDGYLRLRESCRSAVAGLPDALVGTAPHSLRAVTPDQLAIVLGTGATGPIHLHIAEQLREVDDCLAWSSERPVEWLFNRHAVDDAWCLVHATHLDAAELDRIVASGSVVGLCPITEANLGDGLFPAAEFLDQGGRFGVGSDSNVRIDAAEELRLLEYGQRLFQRKRAVLARDGGSCGRSLVDKALDGGSAALGITSGLQVGVSADIVALREDETARHDRALDRWIFGNLRIEAVWRAGRQMVADGRHIAREPIERRFANVARRLIA